MYLGFWLEFGLWLEFGKSTNLGTQRLTRFSILDDGQKAVQVYISENDFAHLVTVFCMVIIQNARRPRAPRAPPHREGSARFQEL